MPRTRTYLAIVMVVAFLGTTAAWILRSRTASLPPHFHEVELSVAGMH